MRTSIVSSFLFALVSVVAPPRALAQDAAPPAAAAAPAPVAPPAPAATPAGDWSIGAGVTFGYSTFIGSAFVGSSYVSTPTVNAGAAASLERRVARSIWLVLGIDGMWDQNHSDAPPAGYSGYTRRDAGWAGLSAGLRHEVTGPGAPVAVSFLVLAEGGWLDQEAVFVDSAGGSRRDTSTGWAAGGSLGLAVERQLTSHLAVRASTPLAFASYSRTRTEPDGAAAVEATGVHAGFTLAPRLELRLYF